MFSFQYYFMFRYSSRILNLIKNVMYEVTFVIQFLRVNDIQWQNN
jgi:hypothetical protein